MGRYEPSIDCLAFTLHGETTADLRNNSPLVKIRRVLVSMRIETAPINKQRILSGSFNEMFPTEKRLRGMEL